MRDQQRDASVAAKAVLRERQNPPWQTVAAAAITQNGRRYNALNFDCRLPRAGVCAAPSAIGMAVAEDLLGAVTYETATCLKRRVATSCGPGASPVHYVHDSVVTLPVGSASTIQPLSPQHSAIHQPNGRRL